MITTNIVYPLDLSVKMAQWFLLKTKLTVHKVPIQGFYSLRAETFENLISSQIH